ncbi:MAG: hypothetical protein P9X24_17390 [Candidatus Hatepunaea meridiana]|nr:hypothetical protein [Candidatus Hatepunaea meridiana]
MAKRQAHRRWNIHQWDAHFEGAAGSLSKFPPSARDNLRNRK